MRVGAAEGDKFANNGVCGFFFLCLWSPGWSTCFVSEMRRRAQLSEKCTHLVGAVRQVR